MPLLYEPEGRLRFHLWFEPTRRASNRSMWRCAISSAAHSLRKSSTGSRPSCSTAAGRRIGAGERAGGVAGNHGRRGLL
jgi:hypothetical protein